METRKSRIERLHELLNNRKTSKIIFLRRKNGIYSTTLHPKELEEMEKDPFLKVITFEVITSKQHEKNTQ